MLIFIDYFEWINVLSTIIYNLLALFFLLKSLHKLSIRHCLLNHILLAVIVRVFDLRILIETILLFKRLMPGKLWAF